MQIVPSTSWQVKNDHVKIVSKNLPTSRDQVNFLFIIYNILPAFMSIASQCIKYAIWTVLNIHFKARVDCRFNCKIALVPFCNGGRKTLQFCPGESRQNEKCIKIKYISQT